MSTLTILSYGEIRVTDDERYSVFDTIEVIGGKNNPHQSWKNLSDGYPEVLQKIENFQFPGQGQRPTPVANKLSILYIIGLLPGAVGRSYREDAAKAMLDKLEGKQKVNAAPQSAPVWTVTPDYVEGLLRRTLENTSLSPETQAIAVLRGVSSTFPQLKPAVDDAIAILQESTATIERHVTPTKIGELYAKKFNLASAVSPREINVALEAAGLQHQEIYEDKKTGKIRKIWHLTERGESHGVVYQDKSQHSSKTVECVRWLPSVIDLIHIKVNA